GPGVLGDARPVREVAPSRRLATGSFERRQTFLAGGHLLGEDPFQVARQHNVAYVDRRKLQAEGERSLCRILENLCPDVSASCQKIFERPAAHGLAKGHLEQRVKGPRTV